MDALGNLWPKRCHPPPPTFVPLVVWNGNNICLSQHRSVLWCMKYFRFFLPPLNCFLFWTTLNMRRGWARQPAAHLLKSPSWLGTNMRLPGLGFPYPTLLDPSLQGSWQEDKRKQCKDHLKKMCLKCTQNKGVGRFMDLPSLTTPLPVSGWKLILISLQGIFHQKRKLGGGMGPGGDGRIRPTWLLCCKHFP